MGLCCWDTVANGLCRRYLSVAVALTVWLWQPWTVWGQTDGDSADAAAESTTEVAEEESTVDEATDEPADEPAAPAEESEATTEPSDDGDAKLAASMENDFSSYLHFALIGQFDLADRYAQALLANERLSPLSPEGATQLIELTDRYKDSIDILLMMINNTSIAENARKVMALIREAQRGQRKAPERIVNSIALLAGTPTQYATGMERLQDSGEYAVPWLLQALSDPAQKDLRPFVLRALAQLGRKAVNPLLAALGTPDPVLQRYVVESLGRIGYPQSLPYLKQLATDSSTNDAVRQAAVTAIGQLAIEDKAAFDLPAAAGFAALAEQYYAEVDSLMPDPRDDQANVWVMGKDMVEAIAVPRAIYPQVMCMRVSEASLAVNKAQPNVVALWLAADFRREARLGLDVQDDEVVKTADLSRPEGFLRGVYFARAAGPLHAQKVLQRAVKDQDREVALGAIAALNRTAGPAVMVDAAGQTGLSLASALQFPDLLVRIRAALALAAARPQQSFKGSDEVVPILASALALKSEKFYILIEPQAALRDALAEGLARGGAVVIATDRLETAMARAHQERTHLDGIFLASDMHQPSLTDAVRTLHKDLRFALTPVVVYAKAGGAPLLAHLPEVDPRVGQVTTGDGTEIDADFAELLLKRNAEVAPAYGFRPLDENASVELAEEALKAMRGLIENRNPVLDVRVAEPALEAALSHPSEPIRILVVQVLGGLDVADAQKAVAATALDESATKELRMAAMASLAESARRFGPKLDAADMDKLTSQAFTGEDLELRTAASAALGAMNPRADDAADIILKNR